MKTNNAYSSRYKVTRNKKVLRRKQGQNHFKAKHPRRHELKKRNLVEVDMSTRTRRRFLPNT